MRRCPSGRAPRSTGCSPSPESPILKEDLSVQAVVARALAEDLGERGDLTSEAAIPAETRAAAEVVARQPGVVAGQAAAAEVLRQTGLRGEVIAPDGTRVGPGDEVLRVEGGARDVLTAERTLLNLMCRLSGIATMTAAFVKACHPVPVLDTRKTTPGLRGLEKDAVLAGGGTNHRRGLYDRVLIKDNHLALGGIALADAVKHARELLPGVEVEVEADDLDGLETAIAAGADWVLLDNMDAGALRRAVRLSDGRARLEASGGMTLDRAREAAATGVDAVSVGALTHSAPALDLGLDIGS